MQGKERSYMFDNIKALLIVLVVFGHVAEEMGNRGVLEPIRAVIYSVHMPLFIFISGYFSKNLDKAYQKACETCLVPYLFFDTLWMILVQKKIVFNILTPKYVFWYMLSLFFWRISLKYLVHIRGILVISFAIGVYIGCFHEVGRLLSISRTIVFLPFFLLGFFCEENELYLIKKIPKLFIWSIGVIAFGAVIYGELQRKIPVKVYENIQCYNASGVSNIFGMKVRIFQYIVALLLSIVIISLTKEVNTKVTKIGQRTAEIYLLSSFVMKGIFAGLGLFHIKSLLQTNNVTLVISCFCITIVILFICSRNKVHEEYRYLMMNLTKLIIKPF